MLAAVAGVLSAFAAACGGSADSPVTPAAVGPPVTVRISPAPLIGTVVNTGLSATLFNLAMDVQLTDTGGRGARVTEVTTVITTTYSLQGITTSMSLASGMSTSISIPPSGTVIYASQQQHAFRDEGGTVSLRIEVKGDGGDGRPFSTSSPPVAVTLPFPAGDR